MRSLISWPLKTMPKGEGDVKDQTLQNCCYWHWQHWPRWASGLIWHKLSASVLVVYNISDFSGLFLHSHHSFLSLRVLNRFPWAWRRLLVPRRLLCGQTLVKMRPPLCESLRTSQLDRWQSSAAYSELGWLVWRLPCKYTFVIESWMATSPCL